MTKVGPQPLGERQHHLLVRDRGEQVLMQPQAPPGQPPRVAGGAEVTVLAAKRHQELGVHLLTHAITTKARGVLPRAFAAAVSSARGLPGQKLELTRPPR